MIEWVGRLFGRRDDGTDLSKLTAAEQAVLRPMSDLFRILARPSVLASSLAHCEAVYDDIPPPAGESRLVSAVRGALLLTIADGYQRLGLDQDRARVVKRAKADTGLRRTRLLTLQKALRGTWIPAAQHRDVIPVVWALLQEWRRWQTASAPPVITAFAAAFWLGSGSLVDEILELVETNRPGYANEVLESCFARAQLPLGELWRVELAMTSYVLAGAMLRRRPDDVVAADFARRALEQCRVYLPGLEVEAWLDGTFLPQWRDPASAGVPVAAQTSRVHDAFAVFSALLDERAHNEESLRRMVATAHEQQFGQVRRVVSLGLMCERALRVALDLCARGEKAEPTAIRIAELQAECLTGAVVREEAFVPGGESEGTAYLDLPFGDTQDLDPLTLREKYPHTVFAWINAHPAGGAGGPRTVFRSCGIDTSTGRMWAFESPVPAPPTARVAVESRDLRPGKGLQHTGSHLAHYASLIPLTGSAATRVVIIPNHEAWHIPWARALPERITEVFVCPSAAAMMRRRAARAQIPARPGRRQVLALFETELPGARAEQEELVRLHEAGSIDLAQAHSFAELREMLQHNDYDLLTIAVHGTSGDGAEYRLMLPDREATPAMIFGLKLPPVVVLGSCWSARTTLSPDMVATAVGCLAAGADMVVGGLWAIDDRITGRVLAEAYRRFADDGGLAEAPGGNSFAAALRAACLAEDDAEVRALSAGLSLVGFPAALPDA